ncbi:hypothetical protein KKB28_07130, partial [bacterium]|nr:hypothetical protein [bacterium]
MTAVHRVFILCCLTMSVMVAAFAQPPDTLWTRMFGGNGFDDFLHVCEAPNDGYVLAGVTEFGGNRGWDWWSVKVSNDGNFVWQQTYDSDSFEVCTNVIPTDDGGYLLMGWNGTFWDRAVVVKTNAIGDSLWSCIYDYSGYNNLRGGLQTADRGYILAGTTGWENDFWLMKINSVGDSLWSRTYTYFGSYNNWLGSVIETFDGGFLLGGETWPSDTREYDFWVVKTDNEGNLQWDKTYGGADWEQLSEMVETSDSCYVLAGCTQSYGSGERDYWILKINAQGDSLWSHAFGGSQQDWCYSICQSPNGGFLLAGYNASYDTLNAYGWIVRTDANGDSLWSHLFSGVYGSQFWSVRQTRDEGYI